jgi:hypothetical protein
MTDTSPHTPTFVMDTLQVGKEDQRHLTCIPIGHLKPHISPRTTSSFSSKPLRPLTSRFQSTLCSKQDKYSSMRDTCKRYV